MRSILSCVAAFSLFLASPRHAQAIESPTSNEAAAPADVSGTAAPRPAKTNSPSPAFLSIAITAATGAWILSGVDWTRDDDSSDRILDAPRLSKPDADAVVEPGPIVFQWTAVKSAASYVIDIDICAEPGVCSDFRLERVVGLSFAVDWPVDAPAGRWRVRAVDADSVAGRWSEFRVFSRGSPAME